jgi:hypothetical protein
MGIGAVISMFAGKPSVTRVRLDELVVQIDRSKPKEPKKERKSGSPKFVIDELTADGTTLIIHPKHTWKEPLQYDLKSLRMRDVGLDDPMQFVSVLTNAKPPGLIHTTGTFGPFDVDEPGDTPLRGDYKFDNADLGDFKGIGGILSSKGTFEGQLARIIVDGTTDTPDFHVDVSGNKVHLKTNFHAIVDGTDGDTFLDPVTATFENSKIVVRGGVYNIRGVKGKTIRLDVDVEDGRIEDMMTFAIKSEQPILMGPIRYTAKMEIPPGKERVVSKLKLDGVFKVPDGRFTGREVREKLGSMSNKAQGEPEAPVPQQTATSFSGHFQLDDGLLALPDLAFDIPGAQVRLKGSYNLLSEMVDFQGVVRMQARVSETTTGAKSFLLKLVDPLLKGKNGQGSEIPVTIKGHRSKPDYGLDIGKVLKKG